MEQPKVINNNTPNPLSPEQDSTDCGRINPDKFTFLNSNQLITKYVKKGNVRENKMTEVLAKSSINAYELCDQGIAEHEKIEKEKAAKTEKIWNQAKKNCNKWKEREAEDEAEVDSKVKKIQVMIDATHGKCADIMYGRNNSTFRRKTIDNHEISLKDMKEHTFEKSLKKVETTRKVMMAKSQKMLEKIPFDPQLSLEVSMISDSFSNNHNNSFTSNSTNLENEISQKKKKDEKENILKKLVKSCSYDNLYNAKRRQAANEGFSMCWEVGNTNKKTNKFSMFEEAEKGKKKILKKGKKQDYKQSCMQEIWENEKFELFANKMYNKAFNDHVSQYEIIEKC